MSIPAPFPGAAAAWPSCAARSRELDEQLAGSGALAHGWVGVEHDGGWTPGAPGPAELGPLAASLAAAGVRLQLLRRHGRRPTRGQGRRTVLLAHAAVEPDQRWLRRLEVDDLASLPDLVPADATTRPAPPTVGQPVAGDVWLVCTHGRRDACCAVHGRPVAAAIEAAGGDVWETTHTGGHRFAATAVLLPDGLALGRLDTADPTSLAARLAGGELPPGLLRGRSGVPQPVQAAEALVRLELGVIARDGLLPRRWAGAGDATTVLLAGPAGTWTATVRTAVAAVARPVSDGAAATTPAEHTLVALVPGDSLRPA